MTLCAIKDVFIYHFTKVQKMEFVVFSQVCRKMLKLIIIRWLLFHDNKCLCNIFYVPAL